MKKLKIIILAFIILINSISATGCWNYREIEKMSIVAGIAIDKGTKNRFQVTIEIIRISSGKEAKMTSETITTEGKSMFDVARNIIAITGKKLYWGHSKVIILSKQIASEGVTKVIDWYNRDAETREDVHIFVSKRKSAKEIFNDSNTIEDIKSLELEETVHNQKNLGKAPISDIMEFDIESKTKGASVVIPAIDLKQTDGKMAPEMIGTAIIKNDKLVGFLNAEETKEMMFIRNEIKGGILVEEIQEQKSPIVVSLEIFKNKTKVIPIVDGDKDIKINLNIDTTVAIDEIEGTENFIEDKGRIKLEKSVENTLKRQIEFLIQKVQSEYDADIFGFGEKLYEDKIQVWNKVGYDWEKVFKNLKVNVKTTVHIKNSAVLSKTLKEGD